MCGLAVIAVVLDARGEQDDLPFPWCEGALFVDGVQREITFQDCRVIRKGGHQVGDETERLLNLFQYGLAASGAVAIVDGAKSVSVVVLMSFPFVSAVQSPAHPIRALAQ